MGLTRASIQPTVAPVTFPSSATVTDLSLSTTPQLALPARTDNRRRGFVIENDGVPTIIFAYGTTVSVAARTAQLFTNDAWDDTINWQGAVSIASVGGNGSANITEMVIL